MSHSKLQKFDISGGISPTNRLLPRSSSSASYTDSISKIEWWYVFSLQFLIWWASWTFLDSVPGLLGFSEVTQMQSMQWGLIQLICGSILYLVDISKYASELAIKIRTLTCFIVICCGLWGLLDVAVDAIRNSFGVSPLMTRCMVLGVAVLLGGIHHNTVRRDYLLDHIL